MTRKTRRYNAVVLSLAGVGVALLAIVLYVVSIDHGYLKAEVERRLSATFGRQVVIDGDMHLTFRRNVRLSVAGLRIVSGDWTEKPDLMRIGTLSASLRTSSLFRGPVEIQDLAIDDTLISLEKHPDGRVNWDLGGHDPEAAGAPQKAGGVAVVLRSAMVTRTRAVLESPDLEQKLYVTIDSLSQSIDDGGVIDTTLAGNVNDTALTFAVQVDSLPKLIAGRDVGMTLDGSLGEVRLAGRIYMDDLAQPERPSVDLELHGPNFAYLAAILRLPARHTGALTVDVKLEPQDARLAFDIDGEIGALRVRARGQVDDLTQPKSIEAQVDASGPNAAVVAAAFGAKRVPQLPFSLVGKLENRPDDVRFHGVRLRLGANEFSGSGVLRPAENMAVDADITAQGPSAADIGAWFGVGVLPAEPFSIRSRIARDSAGLRFADLHASVAGNELTGNGNIRAGEALLVDARLAAQGPDAAVVAGWFGIGFVPAGPYEITGRVANDKDIVRLEKLDARLGANRVSGDMTVRPGDDFSIDASLYAEGPSAADFGVWFNFGMLPADPFSIRSRIARNSAGMKFTDVHVNVGGHELTGKGTIRTGEALAVDAELAAAGPDAAAAASWFDIDFVPAGPYEVTARVASGKGVVRLEKLDAQLGANRLSGDLTVRPGDDLSIDAALYAEGPDAAAVAAWFDVSRVPAQPFTANARVRTGDGGIRLEDMRMRLGRNEFKGSGAFRLGEVPSFDAVLSADRLDISEFLRAEPDEAAQGGPPSAESDRLIPDTPVPFHLFDGFEARIDVRVGEIVAAARKLRDVGLNAEVLDGRLLVEDFEVTDEAGGRLTGAIALGRNHRGADLRLRLAGSNLNLGLPAATEAERKALPHFDVVAAFDASGTTLRDLFGSASGYARLESGPGRLRLAEMPFFTNDFLSQILNTVNPLLKQDPYTAVECALLIATIEDGTTDGESMLVFRSTRLDVIARAEIDLAVESVRADITTMPRQGRGVSLSELLHPYVQVGGTLANPHFEIDKKSTLIEGGAAIATGGLSILAKGLFERVTAGENPCTAAEQAAAPKFDAFVRKYGGDLSAAH